MRLISLLFILVFTFAGEAYSQEIITGFYTVRRSQKTPLEVLNRGLKISRADIYGQGLIDNLLNYNPSVEDWDNLEEGQQLYIELPINVVSEATLLALHSEIPDLGVETEKAKEEKVVEKKKDIPQRKKYQQTYIAQDDGSFIIKEKENLQDKKSLDKTAYSASLFYAASFGDFQEVTANQIKSSTKENSPVTIGIAGGYQMNAVETLTTSAYYSIMKPVEYQGEFFPVTDEFGWNLYYQTGKPGELIFHGGVDYESFSLFNTLQYEATGDTSLSLFSMVYLTAGASKLMNFGGQPVFFRLGFSKTINSDVQGALINYHGEKFIFFVSIPVVKNISVTSFYKTHFLSGDTQLNISRIGFGLNFSVL